MKFEYKNNEYELMELVEPHKNETFDMLAIFRVKYVIIDKDLNKIEVSKDEEFEFEDYEYINYFCNQGDKGENLQAAKYYIDEWLTKNTKTKSTIEQAIELLSTHFIIDEHFMDSENKQKWVDCINSLNLLKGVL